MISLASEEKRGWGRILSDVWRGEVTPENALTAFLRAFHLDFEVALTTLKEVKRRETIVEEALRRILRGAKKKGVTVP